MFSKHGAQLLVHVVKARLYDQDRTQSLRTVPQFVSRIENIRVWYTPRLKDHVQKQIIIRHKPTFQNQAQRLFS